MSKERELIDSLRAQVRELTGALNGLTEMLAEYRDGLARARMEAEIERDTQRAIGLGRRLRFLSGRWPLRDGDHFVNVSAPEPKHADDPDPTGDK